MGSLGHHHGGNELAFINYLPADTHLSIFDHLRLSLSGTESRAGTPLNTASRPPKPQLSVPVPVPLLSFAFVQVVYMVPVAIYLIYRL